MSCFGCFDFNLMFGSMDSIGCSAGESAGSWTGFKHELASCL